MHEIQFRFSKTLNEYEQEFITAYRDKKVINNLLAKCGLDVKAARAIFLNFEGAVVVCSTRNGIKWYVSAINSGFKGE
jgi:hypothetical protein